MPVRLEQPRNQRPRLAPIRIKRRTKGLPWICLFQQDLAPASEGRHRQPKRRVRLAGHHRRTNEHSQHRGVDRMPYQSVCPGPVPGGCAATAAIPRIWPARNSSRRHSNREKKQTIRPGREASARSSYAFASLRWTPLLIRSARVPNGWPVETYVQVAPRSRPSSFRK